jgi:hypothetical protein
MKKLWTCRRTFLATLATVLIFTIGMVKNIDVTNVLASIALGLGATNAAENIGIAKKAQ